MQICICPRLSVSVPSTNKWWWLWFTSKRRENFAFERIDSVQWNQLVKCFTWNICPLWSFYSCAAHRDRLFYTFGFDVNYQTIIIWIKLINFALWLIKRGTFRTKVILLDQRVVDFILIRQQLLWKGNEIARRYFKLVNEWRLCGHFVVSASRSRNRSRFTVLRPNSSTSL